MTAMNQEFCRASPIARVAILYSTWAGFRSIAVKCLELSQRSRNRDLARLHYGGNSVEAPDQQPSFSWVWGLVRLSFGLIGKWHFGTSKTWWRKFSCHDALEVSTKGTSSLALSERISSEVVLN